MQAHEAASKEFINILLKALDVHLTSNAYYLYEYLRHNVSEYSSSETTLKYYYEKNKIPYWSADSTAWRNKDANTTNFIVTQSLKAIFASPESNFGYFVNYFIPKCLLILSELGELEDYKTTPLYGGTMKQLQFKGSPIICYVHFLEKDFYKKYEKSIFLVASNKAELQSIIGGNKVNFETVLNKFQIPTNYWKIFPSGKPRDTQPLNSEIKFSDFFRNEILRAEHTKRNSLLSDLSLKDDIFTKHKGLTDNINRLGYLLSGALTLNNYNMKESSEFSYLNRFKVGIDNTMKPTKALFSFADDIFDAFINTA